MIFTVTQRVTVTCLRFLLRLFSVTLPFPSLTSGPPGIPRSMSNSSSFVMSDSPKRAGPDQALVSSSSRSLPPSSTLSSPFLMALPLTPHRHPLPKWPPLPPPPPSSGFPLPRPSTTLLPCPPSNPASTSCITRNPTTQGSSQPSLTKSQRKRRRRRARQRLSHSNTRASSTSQTLKNLMSKTLDTRMTKKQTSSSLSALTRVRRPHHPVHHL